MDCDSISYLSKVIGISLDANVNCKICATVVTGFESVSAEECKEKLATQVITSRGKIYFNVLLGQITKLKELKSVDNLAVVVADRVGYCIPQETMLQRLLKLPQQLDWRLPMYVWHLYTGNPYPTFPAMNEFLAKEDEKKISDTGAISCQDCGLVATPRFRVTCKRVGSNHQFTSMDCAAKFGGAINDTMQWHVDLTNADINVLLNVVNDSISISILLTKASLHKRNIIQLGPTTLRSTIAYNMLRVCNIQMGDIVCDPMAGGGSISIEGTTNWKSSYHICGDNYVAAGARAVANRDYVDNVNDQNQTTMLMDIATWDVCRLPLLSKSVDVIVSDMPFGKRIGSKQNNWNLYLKALTEMARICRPTTGRAVLLTEDKKVMTRIIKQLSQYWTKRRCYWTNIGGLKAAVYYLGRTSRE